MATSFSVGLSPETNTAATVADDRSRMARAVASEASLVGQWSAGEEGFVGGEAKGEEVGSQPSMARQS